MGRARKKAKGIGKEARRAMQRRKKNLYIMAFAVLAMCGVISYKKIELKDKIASSEKRIAQLEKEKEAEEKRAEELEEYKAYVETKKYIEQEARSKLGLVYPDEIIFEPEQ